MPILFFIDAIVYTISSVISFSLCLIVFAAGPAKRVNQFFCLFSFSSALWTFFAALVRIGLWLKLKNWQLFGEISAYSFLFLCPFLLLFTSRFLDKQKLATSIAGGFFVCLSIALGHFMFNHRIVYGYYFGPSGTTHLDLSVFGIALLFPASGLVIWSIVLFWLERKNLREKYLPWSAVIFLLGIIFGLGLDIEFPVLSFVICLSVCLLGFGILSQQLFNPLRERNLELGREIAERMRTEEALRKSEAQVKALLQGIPDGIFYIDREGRVLDYKAPKGSIFGESESIIGKKPDQILPQHVAIEVSFYTRQAIETDEMQAFEFSLLTGKRKRHFEARIVRITDSHAIALIRDVTDRKAIEERLVQSQKMEAIDRLAGGIAHDFNNLLTVISSYTDLSIDNFPNEKVIEFLKQIKVGTAQATQLTNQLLAFSRKQEFAPKIVSLNTIIRDMETMIRRILGDSIELTLDLDPSLYPLTVDPGRMQQVIMNLSMNAKDALVRGGIFSIKTENCMFGERSEEVQNKVQPGRFIRILFRDSGSGMDKETIDRIFEPFFTTKKERQGTGLGLSIVHSIVTQSNGRIFVKSEPGIGTEMSIVLPTITNAAGKGEAIDGKLGKADHNTILLIEDDELVRDSLVKVLYAHGYNVQTGKSYDDACSVLEESSVRILISDINISGEKSGYDLSAAFSEKYPGMKIILISGCDPDARMSEIMNKRGISVLKKPFDVGILLEKISPQLR
jgi:PAS domain S-box-containing protein